MCVCMNICTYIHTYVCMYVCMYECIRMYGNFLIISPGLTCLFASAFCLEGNAAVSTIEAIKHTAQAAGKGK